MRSKADPFDLVFVDAHKRSYSSWLALLLDTADQTSLLTPNALVVFDNAHVALHDDGPRGRDMQKFLQECRNDPRLHCTLLPLRDGVLIVQRLAQ